MVERERERQRQRANHRQVSASICVTAAALLLHSYMYVLKECQLQICPFGKHIPVPLHLLGFTFCISPIFSSRASQMLPSSTSSTTRQPRTLRSCGRLVLMSPPFPRIRLLPRLLRLCLLADLCHPFHPPSPHTGCPSPVSKACLSPSLQRLKAGLRHRVSPYPSLSPPPCGGSSQA